MKLSGLASLAGTGITGLARWSEDVPDVGRADESQLRTSAPMRSRWSEWPDMPWVGPAFWGNRLQDWQIAEGKVECVYSGSNRNLHCLTHQLDEDAQAFATSVDVEVLNRTDSEHDYVGFRLGVRASDEPCPVTFVDYRRAAVYGEGVDVGVTTDGRLFIGENLGTQSVALTAPIRLELRGKAEGRGYELALSAIDTSDGRQIDRVTDDRIDAEDLAGNVALVAHFDSEESGSDTSSARFSDWRLAGSRVVAHPGQVYGPILFAQYTLDRGVLKLTAQLAPVATISGHTVSLQIREGGRWECLEETTVHELARTAHFRIEDWAYADDVPYRICVELPLRERTEEYVYEGTIAAEPVAADPMKAAMFSCNQDHGFPDTEVVHNVARHHPDMAMFLGDQFYEGFGGFGVERSRDLEKATLDYLRKWYMFGWSYRDLFRHVPSVFIPDDHDVFHGNIWGQGGKAANVEEGYGGVAHDTGGYQMPAEWVNMVERTQTSHLPDPYDPTPVEQGIGVYYTDWNYGGVSFAVLEDRKFKPAPGNVLPAEVVNGFVQDEDFDITEYYDIDAELLGERQEAFLEAWVRDWSHGAQMKVVLSQSPFCGAHTLPEGAKTDSMAPGRPIPKRGEYPAGDTPAEDMDTNGWPPKKRDKALRTIRKTFALHVAGDQHLASVIQYGVDAFGDAGFVFTLPALNNTWPRRWWPTVEEDHQPLMGRPTYTGHFKDAFGNRMTVLAVRNPVQTSRIPAIIYDRVTGYGILHFDKKNRSVRLECWPRYVDPIAEPHGQYEGWPITIEQQENYGRQARGFLPEFNVNGLEHPVVEVFNQDAGELEYALRINGRSFKPKVFEEALYRVRIGDPDLDQWKEYDDVGLDEEGTTVTCEFT